MFTPTRRLSAVVVPVFVAVAIIGFLAGHRGAHTVPSEKLLTAFVASVALEHPSAWQSVAAAPQIRGLSIAHALVLAPAGNPTHAGLIAGQLPGGEPSPLPRPFIAQMRQLPDTVVVDLVGTQAYRYARLNVPGFDRELTLYTIPNPGGEATALACYASAGFAADMRTCEHIVATLALVGRSQGYDLTQNAAYARQLTASIAALDQQRLVLRREMSQQASSLTLQRTAAHLASVFAHAAESISTLEPSLAAGRAQSALAASLVQARDAYTTFAAAVNEGGPAGLAAARQRVYEAEASVDSALEDFALLGYKQA
jgi:hypothetical protein